MKSTSPPKQSHNADEDSAAGRMTIVKKIPYVAMYEKTHIVMQLD